MWRRTTGGLLEVRRRARGSGAPLPAIWRSSRECPFETRDEETLFGLPDEHIWLQSKIKLKINHWRSSPEPPELAGFYVDSVKF